MSEGGRTDQFLIIRDCDSGAISPKNWSRIYLKNFIISKVAIEMSLPALWIALLFHPLSLFFFFSIELRVFPLVIVHL